MERMDFSSSYQILKFDVNKVQNDTVLNWQFISADYFLIFINDGTYEFELSKAIQEMEEAEVDEDRLIHCMSDEQLFTKEGAKFRVYCVSEREFSSGGRNFKVPASGMKRNIPYEVRVYACSYKKNGFRIFDAKKDENVRFIQAPVHFNAPVSKKFLKKNYICNLSVSKLDDYKDGAIMYHVDGVDSDFPLPATCLGRDLTIVLPQMTDVTLRIRDEYKKYYRKS